MTNFCFNTNATKAKTKLLNLVNCPRLVKSWIIEKVLILPIKETIRISSYILNTCPKTTKNCSFCPSSFKKTDIINWQRPYQKTTVKQNSDMYSPITMDASKIQSLLLRDYYQLCKKFAESLCPLWILEATFITSTIMHS